MRREIPVGAITGISVSAIPDASQKFGHTDREVHWGAALQRAEAWAAPADFGTILGDPIAEVFRGLIRDAAHLSGGSFTLYRGQAIPGHESVPPTTGRLGPLPPDRTPKEGRYHREGERVLYLADSHVGVWLELENGEAQGTRYVIKADVPLAGLKIADFTALETDSLISAVFAAAETCKVDGRGPNSYAFSQVVGNIVSDHFDGMIVPGVRGAPGAHYKNVVLFRSHDAWPDWVGEAKPERLLPPSGATD